jgi:hypothetical protein
VVYILHYKYYSYPTEESIKSLENICSTIPSVGDLVAHPNSPLEACNVYDYFDVHIKNRSSVCAATGEDIEEAQDKIPVAF